MNEDITSKLRNHYVRDLQKKDIDHFERAEILRYLIDDEGLSIRGFSDKYGFAKSTVEDWLLWNRISEDEYQSLVANGHSHTEIYRNLRSRKSEGCSIPVSELDLFLDEVCKRAKGFISVSDVEPTILDRIDKARDSLANLKVELKLKQKRAEQ